MTTSLPTPLDTPPLILLVDDENGIRMLMEQIFATQGYRTLSASSGTSALAILESGDNPIDVVVLDLMMPGMSGLQLLHTRDRWADPSIRVLMLSAVITAADKIRSLEAGAVDFIEKPFRRAELLIRVDTHVRLRRYEQSLVAERNQLRTLIDNLPGHIYFKDVNGRFVAANQALADSLGLPSPEAVIGKTNQDLYPPERAIRLDMDEQQALGEGIPTIDRVDISLDAEGSKHWWQRSVVPLRNTDRTVTGLVAINRDVTRRMQAEETLRTNEMQLRRILETVADAIVIVDDAGAINMINPAVESMFNDSADALMHRPVTDLLAPRLAPLYAQVVEEISRTAVGTYVRQIEVEGLRRDGTTFPASVAVSDMLLAERRFLIAVVRDITEQKQVEQSLRRYSDQLEEMVAERTADLTRAQQELLKQERLSRELELASQVQASLLAQEEPVLPGYGIAARALPARYVSGDFFDFLEGQDARLGIALGDIAGKGIAAALLTSTARALVRREAQTTDSPAQILAALNNAIHKELEDAEMFITSLFGSLDLAQGVLTYASAGHTDILWHRAAMHESRFLAATGLPLGIDADLRIAEETVLLRPGDILAFYSDGITEAMNAAGGLFGPERLQDVIARHRAEPADAIAAAVLEHLHVFSEHAAIEDDVTLIVLKAEPRMIARTFDSTWSTLNAATTLVYTCTLAYGKDFADRLELVASELVTNCIKHAYKNATGEIKITLELAEESVVLCIYDHGIRFDPDAVPEPELGQLIEGGYGLYIVRQLVDDATYTREDGWNVWRISAPVA